MGGWAGRRSPSGQPLYNFPTVGGWSRTPASNSPQSTVTYSFATFELRFGGASAGINAKPESRDDALAAFVEEVAPLVESGSVMLRPGTGLTGAAPGAGVPGVAGAVGAIIVSRRNGAVGRGVVRGGSPAGRFVPVAGLGAVAGGLAGGGI